MRTLRAKKARKKNRRLSVCSYFIIATITLWALGVCWYWYRVFTKKSLPKPQSEIVEEKKVTHVHQNELAEGTSCSWEGPFPGFLPGCPKRDGALCKKYHVFHEAQDACALLRGFCGGVVAQAGSPMRFELREGSSPYRSTESAEWSYVMNCSKPVAEEFTEEDRLLDESGTFIDGNPTIYIGIASYRDSWCHRCITSALERATYPERLVFGVVQQNAPGDMSCLHTEESCSTNPSQTLCRFRDQIKLEKVDAKDAKGPVFARHKADMLYDGEYFALQVDAHTIFVRGWDETAIRQWKNLKNDYGIMSTYPSDLKNNIDENGDSRMHLAPYICRTELQANGVFTHLSAYETRWPERWKDTPLLSPFLGGGVLWSRGHRLVRVPYDCCMDMVFAGEEWSLGVRAWTWGYDLYAPSESFAFHPYNRKGDDKPHMFYENKQDPGLRRSSLLRMKHILGTPLEERDISASFNDTELERYSLGKYRSMDSYMAVFGLNYDSKKQVDYCNRQTLLMDSIHPFVRKNGKGVDYRYVKFGTWNELDPTKIKNRKG